VKQALIEFLLADAGLAALVGRNIYWGRLPQGLVRSAVTVRRISILPISTQEGVAITGHLIQTASLADTPAKADRIARALRAACLRLTELPFRGCEWVAAEDDDEPGDAPQGGAVNAFPQVQQDFRIWHIETL
jgi:hypothetical protein